MAFRTADQPFQYHAPVAPEVPVADNTAAKIIAGNTPTLVHAFLTAAQDRRQEGLDREKMVQTAALSMREMDIKQEANKQDYDLKKQYYGIMEKSAGSVSDARSAAAEAKAQGIQMFMERAAAENKFTTEWTSDLEKKHLLDDKWRNEHPGEWVQGKRDFTREYGLVGSGPIQETINKLQHTSDQMKVPITPGVTLGSDGKWIVPGGDKPVQPEYIPVEQIYDTYAASPDSREGIKNALIHGGHGKIVDTLETGAGGTTWFGGKKDKSTHTPTLDPYATNILSAAEHPRASAKSAVPPSMLKSSGNTSVKERDARFESDQIYNPDGTRAGRMRDQRAIDEAQSVLDQENSAQLPAPDLPPDLSPPLSSAQPTRTDKILDYARKAIAYNPGVRDEVMRRLQGLGIDSSGLA